MLVPGNGKIPREPKIHNRQRTLVQNKIRQPQITMDNALRVQIGEDCQELHDNMPDFRLAEEISPLYQRTQRSAWHKLLYEEIGVTQLEEVKALRNAGMVYIAHDRPFFLKQAELRGKVQAGL